MDTCPHAADGHQDLAEDGLCAPWTCMDSIKEGHESERERETDSSDFRGNLHRLQPKKERDAWSSIGPRDHHHGL